MTARPVRAALEQEARELLRSIRLATDDLAVVLEQLRQIREAETAARDQRLIVHDGNGCGRLMVAP